MCVVGLGYLSDSGAKSTLVDEEVNQRHRLGLNYMMLALDSDFAIAGIHGSGILNEYFHEFLKEYLEQDFPAILAAQHREDTPENRQQILYAAGRSFERHKKSFGSVRERPLRINIPGLKEGFRTSRRSCDSDGYVIPRFVIPRCR